MVHRQPVLKHHLFQITIRKLIPAIPAHAHENKCRLEVTPLKRRWIVLHEGILETMEMEENCDYSQEFISYNTASNSA
jgi:hypothetical protein